MSIVKNKFLSFVIALLCVIPFTLCAYGCDNTSPKGPTEAEKVANAYELVVQQLKSNNYKATITETKKSVFDKDMGAGSSIDTNIEDNSVGLELGCNQDLYSMYYYRSSNTQDDSLDNDELKQFQIIDDAEYRYTDDGVDLKVLKTIDPDCMEGVIWQQLFEMGFDKVVTIAQSFNKNILSLTNSDNGYILTANLNITEYLNKVFANIKLNQDKQPIAFINQFIKDTFNQDVTFENLLNEFLTSYTQETTFEDLMTFIKQKFGIDITNEFNVVYALMCAENGKDIEDILSTTISDYLDGYTTAVELRTKIMDKINNPSITLNDIINEDYQGDDVFVTSLHNLINDIKTDMEDVTKLSADKVELKWSFAMDSEYKILSSNIDAACNIKVQDENVLIKKDLSIKVDVEFSDFWQTQVLAPAEVNTAYIEFDVYLNSYEATQENLTKDLSSYAKFTSNLEFKDALNNTVATYDNETQVLTVLLEYVKAQYVANEDIVLEAQDPQTGKTYKFVLFAYNQ